MPTALVEMSNGPNWFTGLLAHELDLIWALMASAAKWTERTLSSRFFLSLLLSTLLFSSSARNLAFSLRRVSISSSCVRLVMQDFDYNHDLDFVHEYVGDSSSRSLSRSGPFIMSIIMITIWTTSNIMFVITIITLVTVFRDGDFALFLVQQEGIISNICIFTLLQVIFVTYLGGLTALNHGISFFKGFSVITIISLTMILSQGFVLHQVN